MYRFLTIFFFILITYQSQSQTNNISGVINSYVKVNQISAGTCKDTLYVASTSGFSVGDTVLLIQIKGATIDTTNTSTFGTISNYNNAGNYEYGIIKSVATGVIVLQNSLTRTYSTSGYLQLVSVPRYVNANVSGVLTCSPWNGNTGGVLAFTASSSVSMSANIDVSGKGFEGGDMSINYYTAWYTGNYCTRLSGRGGDKGDGISTVSTFMEAGRGANSSGGGGGNDINTGAGGGGNAGAGGHGGNNAVSLSILWGEAGKLIDNTVASNKLFLGGGGGGGHQNNTQGSDGSNGGGIVIIRTPTLTGNGFAINTNGIDITTVSVIDGAGGGGAGGSILLDIQTFAGNVSLNAKGGKGGDQIYIPQCHGNGGGGGGGAIKRTGAIAFPANVTTNVNGGNKGVGQCNGTVNDAANGSPGLIQTGFNFPVIPIVVADAGIDKIICSGTTVQIGSPSQPGLTYSWTNGAGSFANPTVNPNVTTTYILTVSIPGSCPTVDRDTVTVTVNPSPVASFTYTVDCSGLTVTFNNSSTGNTSNGWSFGDGGTSLAVSPTHVYPDTGWYSVQLITSNAGACNDTSSMIIHLIGSQYPVAAFTSDTTACSLTVTFNSGSLNATGCQWSFGDGSSSTQINATHTYTSPGIYQVTLVATNTCGTDSISNTITVDPVVLPVASFTSDTNQCSSVVIFTGTSQNALTNVWNFGDGNTSTLQNPSHTYINSGTYLVTLTSSNFCGMDSAVMTVTLDYFLPPVSSFSSIVTPCESIVQFTNTSVNNLTSFWIFGDGDTSWQQSPTHTYLGTGIYNVTLISTNACGVDTVIVTIDLAVSVPPLVSFTYEIVPCSSAVIFSNSSTNGYEWLWDFGDGIQSHEEHPIHEYIDAGTYLVQLVVNESSGCQDTFTVTLIMDETGVDGLFIPNVFTPNNDNKNDRFVLSIPVICDSFTLTIFNRWGQQIFETNDIQKSWDGKHNGVNAPDGVYYYLLKGDKKILYGTVSLFR